MSITSIRGAKGARIGRMCDDCIAILLKLDAKRRVSIAEIAEERRLSERTIYRWIDSISFKLPVEVRGGIVIVGDDFNLHKLHQLKVFSKA